MNQPINFSHLEDPKLAQGLIAAIQDCAPAHANLMEVCGTHTVSIAREGIRSVMPEGTQLLSGPGCPVCVTANADIDTAIALARTPGVVVTTFGDMMRVPGSTSSLMAEKAAGHAVEVVYSPLDALRRAAENPHEQVVFIGVGFETTTPVVAMAVKRAAKQQLTNFSVFVACKNMPNALEAIVNDPELHIDGLILPGHVSTIIGPKPYQFLAEQYGIPGVITGFKAVDILQGIAMLMRQISEGRSEIEIAYTRAVMETGNEEAVRIINEVFETCDVPWRGLGVIPKSGYRLQPAYEAFDAVARFNPHVEPTQEHAGCRCGEVLRGAMSPHACPLFNTVCTPENPIGPCMVSSEGSCAAYYRYYR